MPRKSLFQQKKLAEDLEKLKETIRLSVSSYGLQLYKVLVIADQELKERLRRASSDQRQITECSHLFVFCNYTEVKHEDIDDFIKLKAEIQEIDPAGLRDKTDFMKAKLAEKSEEEKTSWLKRQPYLALSNLLMACAELKIDACPMEGFDPDEYNEILELNRKGLNALVVAPIGYRSEDDLSQFAKKVRKGSSQLFEQI